MTSPPARLGRAAERGEPVADDHVGALDRRQAGDRQQPGVTWTAAHQDHLARRLPGAGEALLGLDGGPGTARPRRRRAALMWSARSGPHSRHDRLPWRGRSPPKLVRPRCQRPRSARSRTEVRHARREDVITARAACNRLTAPSAAGDAADDHPTPGDVEGGVESSRLPPDLDGASVFRALGDSLGSRTAMRIQPGSEAGKRLAAADGEAAFPQRRRGAIRVLGRLPTGTSASTNGRAGLGATGSPSSASPSTRTPGGGTSSAASAALVPARSR